MSRGILRAIPAVAAVLVLAGEAALCAAYAGSNTVGPTTVDVIRYHQRRLYLPAPGGTNITVIAVTLPAGHWVISTRTNGVSLADSPDFVRCEVLNGTTQLLAGSTTVVGAGIDSVGELRNIVAVNSVTFANISLQCWHDGHVGIPNAIYLESSSLHAMKSVAPIDISAD